MAYNLQLTDRVREALQEIKSVEEKEMFRGITFMVDGKMCISVSNDDLMLRIDPDKQEEALEHRGCREMVMKGKVYKGFVYVSAEGFQTKKEFDYWLNLALTYNPKAKATPKKKKK